MTIISRFENYQKLFSGQQKPLIGMIHLPALPGAPENTLNLDQIISFALQELETLIEAQFDGALIENYHDSPFYKNTVDSLTLSSMAIVSKEIQTHTSIPFGINILRNACTEALVISALTGGSFIRCNFWTGVYATDQGIIEGCAADVKRLQKKLSLVNKLSSPMIFADVHCKHATSLSNRSLELEVKDAFERSSADAVIISGKSTGSPIDSDQLQRLGEQNLHPILIGSGINKVNIEFHLSHADGAIIGSSIKEGNSIHNKIDILKAKELVKLTKKVR